MALTDDAIEQIKQMIVSGELRPGTRLPKEDDLAQQLGLSRNSLREAVRALTAMRILIAKQGDGVARTEPRRGRRPAHRQTPEPSISPRLCPTRTSSP